VSEARPAGAADWLSFSATPVFALMAVQAAAHGGAADLLCSAAHGAPWLGGMASMYALMSVFHAAPWIKAVTRATRSWRG